MTNDNRPQVRKVLIITLLLNLFVMGLKAVVGYSTGFLSLLADALHSVTDSANNILGLIASKFSSPIPDREHPYGHHKFEAVGALGIAAFLGIACRFFQGQSQYPNFKKKGKNDSFTIDAGGKPISVGGTSIKLPTIGWVKTYEGLPHMRDNCSHAPVEVESKV